VTGQSNPDSRAAFLAALEHGVSPIVDAGYEKDPAARVRRLAHPSIAGYLQARRRRSEKIRREAERRMP
jgi:hypothetical protein